MATGVLRGPTRRLRRAVDPRASLTGKFVAAAAVSTLVALAVVTVAVWQATVHLATTYGEAQAIYRGGILAVAVVVSGNVVALALVERSVVRGVRKLDSETRRVAETGRYETAFEPTRRDEVGQLAWSVAELRDQLATQVDTVESLNRELATTATAQTRTLSAARRGDLTGRMDEETGVPQFDALATSFNGMMDQMETMVAEVRAFSQSVAGAAREADENATAAREGTVAVTAATRSISEGVDGQHAQLAETAAAMAGLVDRVEAVADRAETVAEKSEAAAAATDEGAAAAADALDAVETIEERTASSVDEIESLSRTVADVSDLADQVRDLTEQTEHLAMNTELEAKKSNDDGSMTHLGKQIRTLSNDTEAAAAEIEDALESVEADTASALSEIERTQAAVERGTDTIGSALGAFDAVEDVVDETAVDAARIDAATDVQTERVAEIRSTVETVREIGAETATEASQVATTAREQETVIGTIEQRVDWLAESAGKLERALEQFTVRSPDSKPGTAVEGRR
ncbi:methyl-accepting chemotaxis protein [Haloarchaeobius iranensis]|uniref:Methyl-accepting chemotaxis protein n=1 Tax=Haloarchaeobius iranensis TaxID=996166 RepID=A0A1G9WZP9_9EURY|nr:methyl-accepting chemotaxis protein [Haloarchaeobius iranensis]SDM89585.1 Methyl-accepting chemotaxis protein [Haloarchaeobius iranensis]